jgi:hypothetical protein
VRGVDFLFALALGQGILLFQDFWRDPLDHDNLTLVLALAAIYFNTLMSFIDWHIAMERDPYLIAWERPFWARTLERCRFATDLLIVATYAFLVVNAVPLMKDPSTDLSVLLTGFPVTFGLYVVWLMLRRRRYPHAGNPLPMIATFGLLVGVYVMYRLPSHPLGAGAEANNRAFALVLGSVVLYRVSNAIGQQWRST